MCSKDSWGLERRDSDREQEGLAQWPALSRIHAGSGSGMLGWGLVLSKKETGLCRFPSNHGRRQAVSQARPSRGKLKWPHAQMQKESRPASQLGMVGGMRGGPLPAGPQTKLYCKVSGPGDRDASGLTVLKHQDVTTENTSQGQTCIPNCLPAGFGHKQGHQRTISGLLCTPKLSSLK